MWFDKIIRTRGSTVLAGFDLDAIEKKINEIRLMDSCKQHQQQTLTLDQSDNHCNSQ